MNLKKSQKYFKKDIILQITDYYSYAFIRNY